MTMLLKVSLLGICSATFAMTHEPLTMDQGFKFSAHVKDNQTIIAQWQMAPGYFLYRKHLEIGTTSSNVTLGKPLYPPGTMKYEEGFGKFEVYKDTINIPVPVISAKTEKVTLSVKYQGCSEEGYCYPPTNKEIVLDLSKADPSFANTTQPIAKSLSPSPKLPDNPLSSPLSEQDQATQLLGSGNYFTIIASFLGFGLLLAFTPCVLPMVPILSGIIVGQRQEQLTTSRAFSLSFTYVLSMSLTYAVAGLLVGFAGGSVQAAFQKPWLLISFSLLFVILALSFFGLYELQLPTAIRDKLSSASHRQKSGSFLGVAIMGCIATLIVSPCVTPALVGALGYIGKTGNALLGGVALFALGFGMGIPLLLIGTAGGKFLPKAGMWMDRIKTAFGFVLIGMAIWMVDRILPGPVMLLLWACLLILSAAFMGLFSAVSQTHFARLKQGFAALFFVYGVLLLIGSTMGHSNALQPLLNANTPLSGLTAINLNEKTDFKPVVDENEIKNAIQDAVGQNKIVMLDFTAKWCTSCKLMENRTFSHPEVIKALGKMVTLKADVTQNDKIAKNLEQKFQVIAPPTLLFFDNTGKELEKLRIVGEMGPEEFLQHLQHVKQASP